MEQTAWESIPAEARQKGFQHFQVPLHLDALPPNLLVGEIQHQSVCDNGFLRRTFAIQVRQVTSRTSFKLPDLEDAVWNRHTAERSLANYFGSRTNHTPYYIADVTAGNLGVAVGISRVTLPTSKRLEKIPCQPGINSPYLYVSTGPSWGFLHKEDLNLLSANVLLRGSPKLWTIIPPWESDKLEARLAHDYGLIYTCDQGIRHLNVILNPEQLRLWNVTFEIVVQNVGDVILTYYGAYHQVYNPDSNMAIAVNGCENDWQPPWSYLPCDQNCNPVGVNELQITREIFIRASTELSDPPSDMPEEILPVKSLRHAQARKKSKSGVQSTSIGTYRSSGSGQRSGPGSRPGLRSGGVHVQVPSVANAPGADSGPEQSPNVNDTQHLDIAGAPDADSGQEQSPDANIIQDTDFIGISSSEEERRHQFGFTTRSFATGRTSQTGPLNFDIQRKRLSTLVNEAVALSSIIMGSTVPNSQELFEQFLPNSNRSMDEALVLVTMQVITADDTNSLVMGGDFRQEPWFRGRPEIKKIFVPWLHESIIVAMAGSLDISDGCTSLRRGEAKPQAVRPDYCA